LLVVPVETAVPGGELELIVDHVGEAQLAVEIRAQR
jgi:hypothetical protein